VLHGTDDCNCTWHARTWPLWYSSGRAPPPQVVFDEALGEDDDEDDDDEDKGFAARDEARFSSPQAPQVTPRCSQFQLAQEAMSNDESEAFYAMAARAVNMSEFSAPQALARAAAAHAKGDKRQYADLIHIATILEAVHSGDDRLRDMVTRRFWQLIMVAVSGPRFYDISDVANVYVNVGDMSCIPPHLLQSFHTIQKFMGAFRKSTSAQGRNEPRKPKQQQAQQQAQQQQQQHQQQRQYNWQAPFMMPPPSYYQQPFGPSATFYPHGGYQAPSYNQGGYRGGRGGRGDEVATTTATAMDITTATTATATTTTATAAMMTTMTARVATTAARLAAGATTTGAARGANMPLRGMARSTDGPVLAHGPGRRSVQRYQRRCLAARLTNTAALAADPVLPHSCDLFSPTNRTYSSGGSSPALDMARDHLRQPSAPPTGA
jgi:hypothetical protein